MVHRTIPGLLASLWLVSCEEAPAPGRSEAVKEPVAVPVVADKAGTPSPESERLQGRHGERIQRLLAHREIGAAYAAGTLGDRLVTDGSLLVDAGAPADTSQMRYFLLNGEVRPATDLAGLKAARGADGGAARALLLGGEDGPRPAIFDDIAAGIYTVCAIVGGAAQGRCATATVDATAASRVVVLAER